MESHEMRHPGVDGTVNHQRLRWGFGVFVVIAFGEPPGVRKLEELRR
jgi:hypothetical protein